MDEERKLLNGWSLIESAPKDGTWVLTWSETEDIGMGRYDEWMLHEGGKPFDQATHWRPLPEPPNTRSGGTSDE
jgi:hypothetical protein